MLKAFAATTFSLLLFFSVYAQEDQFDYETPKKYLVKDIQVSGINYLNPDVLISVSGIAKGDSILVPGEKSQMP